MIENAGEAGRARPHRLLNSGGRRTTVKDVKTGQIGLPDRKMKIGQSGWTIEEAVGVAESGRKATEPARTKAGETEETEGQTNGQNDGPDSRPEDDGVQRN